MTAAGASARLGEMDPNPMWFRNLGRAETLFFRVARRVPYVNHRLSVFALVAALGALAGAIGVVLGADAGPALPLGIVAAFVVAGLCNAIYYAAWRRAAPPRRPPSGPGDPSGDFEPRGPLGPAGAGSVEAPLPEPGERISAITRPRMLRSPRRAR